jgi:hypothetical protein
MFFRTSVTVYQQTRRKISERLNIQQYGCAIVKTSQVPYISELGHVLLSAGQLIQLDANVEPVLELDKQYLKLYRRLLLIISV